MNEYQEFIRSKRKSVESFGFNVDEAELNKNLFPWQKKAVVWALARGRAALFEECGLGKTLQQLEWARWVHEVSCDPVVIHTPVGVRQQTLAEAKKFGIDCDIAVVDEPEKIISGINLINYEKLHKFQDVKFGGVVLDESSILKGLTSVTRKQLVSTYGRTRYRLACTATPAPNDHTELGNHAEFLGICEPVDMLNRYFVHDSGDTSKWRLRGHAHHDFWNWVGQWALCVDKPSRIGGSDDGYCLPELIISRHYVEADEPTEVQGMLFNTAGISATNIHQEKRLTNSARCRKAAELVRGAESAIVWCDTDYESEELAKQMPDAVEVRGGDKDKEQNLLGFAEGKFRILISKPTIAGFGMNYQHCSLMVFAGLSYSFEAYYQAIRRCWRFGQKRTVNVHIILANSDSAIESAIARKESDHAVMQSGMSQAIYEANNDFHDLGKSIYAPEDVIHTPAFLRTERCKY